MTLEKNRKSLEGRVLNSVKSGWSKLSRTAQSALAAALIASSAVSCEPENIDTKAPTIDFILENTKDVELGSIIDNRGGDIYIAGKLVADCEDDQDGMPTTTFSYNGKNINQVNEDGVLKVTSVDKAGNSTTKSQNIKVKEKEIENEAPKITVHMSEVNIAEPKTIEWNNSIVKIGNDTVVSWTDEQPEKCKVSVSLNGKEIKSGDKLCEAGKLTIKIVDDESKTDSVEIPLSDDVVKGMENMNGLNLKVDEKVDLLNGVSFVDGWELQKVELEIDGKREVINNPHEYLPEMPGKMCIVLYVESANGIIKEFKTNELTVSPLEYKDFTIDKANFDKRLGLKVELVPEGEEYLDRKGVFETQALLVEMIEHGTSTMSAQEVKDLLSKNEIIYYGETLNDDTGFENLYEYIDGTEDIGHDGPHLAEITNWLMFFTKNVLMKLNKKMKIYSVNGRLEYEDLLKYVKSHPGGCYYLVSASDIVASNLNEWDSSSVRFERDALKNLVKMSNVWKDMVALGNNVTVSGNDEYEVIKDDENDTENRYYTAWSSGADGIMGSDNSGITHSYTFVPAGVEYSGQYSSHPTKKHIGDDDLRNSVSSEMVGGGGEASSEASMTAIGAYRLSSLTNQLANPNITKDENNQKIRSEADKADVYVDDEYYGSTKSVNPGKTIEQFFPEDIKTCSLSGDMIELPGGLYKNCVFVGPGCVDENGNAVTKDNYKNMIGKKLYISTSLLKKMGKKVGDDLEYICYLCTDSNGTGAGNMKSEAFKHISSKQFSIKIVE